MTAFEAERAEAFDLAVLALLGAGADMATARLVTDDGALVLVAQAGFGLPFVERPGRTSCDVALEWRQVVQVPDLATDAHFDEEPRAALLDAGVRSCVSVPVVDRAGDVRGVLAAHHRSTGVRDAHRLQHVADRLGAVLAPPARSEASDEVDRLRRTMDGRAVLDQAKGILMATMGCGAAEAFRHLVARSQHENRKLREVAEELVRDVARRG